MLTGTEKEKGKEEGKEEEERRTMCLLTPHFSTRIKRIMDSSHPHTRQNEEAGDLEDSDDDPVYLICHVFAGEDEQKALGKGYLLSHAAAPTVSGAGKVNAEKHIAASDSQQVGTDGHHDTSTLDRFLPNTQRPHSPTWIDLTRTLILHGGIGCSALQTLSHRFFFFFSL